MNCAENITRKMQVLIVNGVAQSGKDTFIDALANDGRYEVFKTSIINPVKELAFKVGWDGNKADTERRFLSDLMEILDEYNGYPANEVLSEVDAWFTDKLYEDQVGKPAAVANTHQAKPLVACIVARQPKHIELFKKFYQDLNVPVSTVLIERKMALKQVPNNMADRAAAESHYVYDTVIHNDGSRSMFERVAFQVLESCLQEHEVSTEGSMNAADVGYYRSMDRRSGLLKLIRLYHPEKRIRERMRISLDTCEIQPMESDYATPFDSYLFDSLLYLLASQAHQAYLRTACCVEDGPDMQAEIAEEYLHQCAVVQGFFKDIAPHECSCM